MKFKITLIVSLVLIVALSGCGGNDDAGDNNYGNNDTGNDSWDYNSGNNDAGNDTGGYFEAAPATAATPVPIGSQPQDTDSQTNAVEEYNYAIPGYVNTYQDHLSTFGIDVDTASYSIARNYIENGRLPPAEIVRVEEFINYFDAGYPTPQDIAFGLYADGAPSPFHSPDIHLLRFGVQGYEVDEESRKSVSLTFVVDVSGSMSDPNKLELVKRSLKLLVERLRPEDTVSIVAFGSNATIVLHPTSVSNYSLIIQKINSLSISGATNAEAGLRLGYSLALESFDENRVNRVILCSDGVANVGKTEASELLKFIRGYADIGIRLTTIGFGMGTLNDPFMEELADNGDGSYAYIDTMDEAKRLFVDDLTSTLQVIAKDAKIQVNFNPEVVSHYRLLGYENRDIADEDFRNDSVDAGEIGAGHSVTALYAVKLVPNTQGRIATLQLRWEDPDNGEVIEISGDFNTWDLVESFEDADPHYQLAVVVSQFAEILRKSPYSSEMTVEQLLPYLYALTAEINYDLEVADLTTIMIEARKISK